MAKRPLILCISGHDPSGGAGIQADAEAVAALGGHALTVITMLTVQDTRNVQAGEPVDPDLLRRQVDCLRRDCEIDAVKIGLLGGAAHVDVVLETLRQIGRPSVLDPVLRAGGGAALADDELLRALRERLMPAVDVVTPNAAEARALAEHSGSPTVAGTRLVERGARNVLVTGGDEPGDEVVNLWCCAEAPPREFRWPRLPGAFHGAGCTLAAAIAARLGGGAAVAQALEDAQAYTQRTLQRARAIGRGRRIPGRLA